MAALTLVDRDKLARAASSPASGEREGRWGIVGECGGDGRQQKRGIAENSWVHVLLGYLLTAVTSRSRPLLIRVSSEDFLSEYLSFFSAA